MYWMCGYCIYIYALNCINIYRYQALGDRFFKVLSLLAWGGRHDSYETPKESTCVFKWQFWNICGYLLIFMDDHVWYLVWSMLRQFVPSMSISQLFWASVASPTALTTLKMHREGHGSFSPPRSHAMAEAQQHSSVENRQKTHVQKRQPQPGRVVEHHWLGCVSQFTSGSQVVLTPDIPYENILITRVWIYEPHSHPSIDLQHCGWIT